MPIMSNYQYLERRTDKRSHGLFVRGTGIMASTIWHDRYVSRLLPDNIAGDRDIPVEAVYEALMYCHDHWEHICYEKDLERQRLEERGVFEECSPDCL